MPRQDAVLPHLACIGEPAASLGGRNGRSASSIFRCQAERRKGAVVGDLLQDLGEALEALAIVYGLGRLENPLPVQRFGGVSGRLERRAAGKGEPPLGVLDTLRDEPAERHIL